MSNEKTAEERVCELFGPRDLWGISGSPNRKLAEETLQHLGDAVQAERQRCMADVCEGCREGWEMTLRNSRIVHKMPIKGKGWFEAECKAHRIRARGQTP